MKAPLTEPREMRKAIYEATRYDHNFSSDPCQPFATSSTMARNVLDFSENEGYSGEDAMTVLAYHALLRCEELTRQLIDFHALQVFHGPIVSPAAPPAPPPAA